MARVDWTRIDWIERQADSVRAAVSDVHPGVIDPEFALTFYGFVVALSSHLGGFEAELNLQEHTALLDRAKYADRRLARRKRFTLAHELGHVALKHEGVLHRETIQTIRENYFDGDGEVVAREFEANLFGAAFLMPAESFSRNLHRPIGELAELYRVSRAAAEMRIVQVRPGPVVSGRAWLNGRISKVASSFELERSHPQLAQAVYQLQAAIWRKRYFSLPPRVMREIVPRLSALGSGNGPIEKERWPLHQGATVFEGADFPPVRGDFWFLGCTDQELFFELVLS